MDLRNVAGFTMDLITMIISVRGIQNPGTPNVVRHVYWFCIGLTMFSNIITMAKHIIRYLE